MPEACTVKVVGHSSDGREQYVEDSCTGESRVESSQGLASPPPSAKPLEPPPQRAFGADSRQLVTGPTKHFSTPGVFKCSYDPSLNMSLNPDIVDERQVSDMARQKASCDPDQQKAGQESFAYAIKNHREKVGKVIAETLIPEDPEVKEGLIGLIEGLIKDDGLPQDFKKFLADVATQTSDPDIKKAVVETARQIPAAPASSNATSATMFSKGSTDDRAPVVADNKPLNKPRETLPVRIENSGGFSNAASLPMDDKPTVASASEASRRPETDLPPFVAMPSENYPATVIRTDPVLSMTGVPPSCQVILTSSAIDDLNRTVAHPALVLPSAPGGAEIWDFLKPLSDPVAKQEIFSRIVFELNQALITAKIDRRDIFLQKPQDTGLPAQNSSHSFFLTLTYRPEHEAIELRIVPVSSKTTILPPRNNHRIIPTDEDSEDFNLASSVKPPSPHGKGFGRIMNPDETHEADAIRVVFVPTPTALFLQQKDASEPLGFSVHGKNETTGERIAPRVADKGNSGEHQGGDGEGRDQSRDGNRRGGKDQQGGQGRGKQGDDKDRQHKKKKEPPKPEPHKERAPEGPSALV